MRDMTLLSCRQCWKRSNNCRKSAFPQRLSLVRYLSPVGLEIFDSRLIRILGIQASSPNYHATLYAIAKGIILAQANGNVLRIQYVVFEQLAMP